MILEPNASELHRALGVICICVGLVMMFMILINHVIIKSKEVQIVTIVLGIIFCVFAIATVFTHPF